MRASTYRLGLALSILTTWLAATGVQAATTVRIGAGNATDARLEIAGKGLAEILALELSRGGWYRIEAEAAAKAVADDPSPDAYLIRLRPVAFGSARRGSSGGVAADLLRLAGKGSQVAQVEFGLTVTDGRGSVLWEGVYEGIESRHGNGLPSENAAYLSAVSFLSDEFRLSSLGRAAYKAIGLALADLYAALPQRGRILAVAGDSAVVDLGTAGQVRPGERLAVFRDLGIADSMGQVVWPHLVRCGTLQVVELKPNACLCVFLDGAGETAEGDTVLPIVLKEHYPAEALPDS